MASLYIHVPFCAKKCAYCDFTSYPDCEGQWAAYFAALEDEIRAWTAKVGRRFDTAFIGGGTPSLVSAEYIARIAGLFETDEFTIEANPGTLTEEKLRIYRECGINRISIGVQSFDNALLERIGRIHNAEQAEQAVCMARKAGFDNINIDLMYALPGQSMDMWRATLDRAIDIAPTHISAYSLIIEEGTPIAKWAQPADDDYVNAMQRIATETLTEAGYGRYEVSNYAKVGYECRHNIRYWERGEYIGVGCAAHSLFGGARFSNPTGLKDYLSGVRRVDEEALSAEDEIEETLMLGLRMTRGIPISAIPDIGRARRIVDYGFAEMKDGRFFLNERGLELQDAVVIELLP